MVTVRLSVHVVRAKLSDGTVAEYHYAWRGKGAPRLPGRPGSPEYLAAFSEAHAARKRPLSGTLREVVARYRASPEFTKLGGHSQRAYRRHLDQIEAEFGDMPIKALDDPRVRRHFLSWRDTMAATPRTADYAVGTLKRLLGWAVERVYVTTNQAEPIGRLHSADRSDSIWSDDDLAAFKKAASKELWQAVALASYTGLRQSDLIRLPWSAFDGTSFKVRTSKRGKTAIITATRPCMALMTEIERHGPIILATAKTKRPWTADGLRSSFGKVCTDVGIKRTFHDLRRTAATRLLIAGVGSAELALNMGWSEADVEALKRKYVSRVAMAEATLAKLDRDR